MSDNFKLQGKTYPLSVLSDYGRETLDKLNFTNDKIVELNNLFTCLNISRGTCIAELKREILSRKAGIILGSD